MTIRIGCSGWVYRHWRDGVFYPPGCPTREWLPYYGTAFDTVEVNATFYRLPALGTVRGWAAAAPPSFVFAAKASRYLTHVMRLRDAGTGAARLLERLQPLRDVGKLGPLLWQLPPTFARDEERLSSTLEKLPGELRHAFEFRHPSWFCEGVYALLGRYGAALVIADGPDVRGFQTHELTASFTYVRFHRGSRGRNGNYSEGELDEWARRLRRLARDADVYAYFNNDWAGFAPANAIKLRSLLGRD